MDTTPNVSKTSSMTLYLELTTTLQTYGTNWIISANAASSAVHMRSKTSKDGSIKSLIRQSVSSKQQMHFAHHL